MSITRTCLVPALNSSGDGIENDGQVESSRMRPALLIFKHKGGALPVIKFINVVEISRALGNQGTLPEEREYVGQAILSCKCLYICEELLLWNSNKRIADSR